MNSERMRMGERGFACLRMNRFGNDIIAVRGFAVAVLESQTTGLRSFFRTRNLVTNAGDLFYAERGVAQTVPTNFTTAGGVFDGIMELYNGASPAPAKTDIRSTLVGLVSGSAKAMDATYPKLNDGDTDNPGPVGTDIITYRVSYTTAEANASAIADVIITNPSPAAGEALLCHFEFASTFTKTSSDTLKVFLNHTMNGV